MALMCGVYGFEITRPIALPGGLRMEPRTGDGNQARAWARDLKSYHLTGSLAADSISDDRLFHLEAVLSFIERLDVLITPPQEFRKDDPAASFPPTITSHRRNNGGGAVIMEDTFLPSSRATFILKALARLEDEVYCAQTQFKSFFFKSVETFRQLKPFIEVQYFLLYSGLESYCRAITNDRGCGASVPICSVLRNYGFDVQIERPNDLKRAISTYTHLRNALFHNNELAKTISMNGQDVRLDIHDYHFNLSQLVSLLIMKVVEFDDGHINWNSWIDHQPFK